MKNSTILTTVLIWCFVFWLLVWTIIETEERQIEEPPVSACVQYRLDAVYYKNNFEKCIDNNIAESKKIK